MVADSGTRALQARWQRLVGGQAVHRQTRAFETKEMREAGLADDRALYDLSGTLAGSEDQAALSSWSEQSRMYFKDIIISFVKQELDDKSRRGLSHYT